MQKLAYIGKIVEVNSIEGADFIDSYTVVCGDGGKWMGTSQKGMNVGDLVEVYLQDCIVPKEERFAFLEKLNYRIRMRKFKGVPSEVLIMPLTIVGDVGDNITELVGCEKYEKPISASLSGMVLGHFPSFIPKTDEPNFQGVPKMIEKLRGKEFYSTLKIDGSSGTFYKHDGHFGVCSRNLELKEDEKNAFWRIAREHNIEERLLTGYALQGEMAGPGIQKNPPGLEKLTFFVFNIYSIHARRYMDFQEMIDFLAGLNIDIYTVPVIEYGNDFEFETDEDLRKYAERKYMNGKWAEGVVFRPMEELRVNGERLSFKVINLNYKN